MRDSILYDSAMRLFGDHVSPQLLAAAEEGGWPAALWDAVSDAGYLDVLAEGPGGMAEAVAIMCAAGHRAAPIPLAETMLAHWLCAGAGLEPPPGPLSVAAVVGPGQGLPVAAGHVVGDIADVPWGRAATATAVIVETTLLLVGRGGARFAPAANLAGEPRDRIVAIDDAATAPLPDGLDAGTVHRIGALLRSAQMAGAMEAVLDLAVRYANDRVQFGRPIGRFQAIQQQMALLAEEAAAALVAVECAALRFAEGRASAGFAAAAAKLRAGEAAGRVAEIAHQVLGAIGFTEEHSLHYLTRRLWSWRDEFGDESYWAARLGEQLAAAGPDGLWPLITEA